MNYYIYNQKYINVILLLPKERLNSRGVSSASLTHIVRKYKQRSEPLILFSISSFKRLSTVLAELYKHVTRMICELESKACMEST